MRQRITNGIAFELWSMVRWIAWAMTASYWRKGSMSWMQRPSCSYRWGQRRCRNTHAIHLRTVRRWGAIVTTAGLSNAMDCEPSARSHRTAVGQIAQRKPIACIGGQSQGVGALSRGIHCSTTQKWKAKCDLTFKTRQRNRHHWKAPTSRAATFHLFQTRSIKKQIPFVFSTANNTMVSSSRCKAAPINKSMKATW